MSLPLHRANLGLLVLLGGLCVFQWRGEHETRRQITELRKTAQTQEQKLNEQDESLRRSHEDLDGFRNDIAGLRQQTDEQNVQIRQQKAQVFTLEQDKERSTKQAEAWRTALDNYKSAIGTRDDNIKTLLEQREQLYTSNKGAVEKANQAIVAYNDLTAKYGELVKHYDDLASRYKTEHPEIANSARQ